MCVAVCDASLYSWILKKITVSRFILFVCLCGKFEGHQYWCIGRNFLVGGHTCCTYIFVWARCDVLLKNVYEELSYWEGLQHLNDSAVCVHILCCFPSCPHILLLLQLCWPCSLSFTAYHTLFIEKYCHLIFILFESTMS